MCSNCECDKVAADLGGALTAGESVPINHCRRCGGEAYIVLEKVHFECRECFLETCRKKFRSTIGKSKLVRNEDPILIAYSGGPSSKALLDLLNNSIGIENCREQKFRPSILHIDMQSIFHSGYKAFRVERCNRLFNLLENLKSNYPTWPIYWTTLETAITDNENPFEIFTSSESESWIQNSILTNNITAHETLSKKLIGLDLTDRQKLVDDICSKLMNRVATSINNSNEIPGDKFRYVFLASNATRLANNLLVNVILGEGSLTKSTVNFCDTRPGIHILRPLREFSRKEITFYLRARKIDLPIELNLLTFADRKASIQTATEAFLSKLYIDYPSTYSTLLKTGNKMRN